MKSSLMPGAAFAVGLLSCVASYAQPGPMQIPMVPRAIEMHMQQTRTLEQREAMEAAKATTEPAPASPAPKKRPARKSTKAQGRAGAAAVAG